MRFLTPVSCPMDVDEDGDIDEDDAAAIYIRSLNPVPCPPAKICRWDVNFDCMITNDDGDMILDHLLTCSFPCLCEGDSFTGGGLSIERFAAALASLDPEPTEEQMAHAWQRFFAVLSD